ncbi:zinc-ribbon domain-containing protein [bacterium]|nr:zinc-ribbon domain-containing protein [bacterium]
MEIVCPKCGSKDEVDLSDVPPGKVILRCENCSANFEFIIRAEDIPRAECDVVDAGLSVVCPYCKKRFLAAPDVIVESEFWRCPSCEAVFRVVGDEAQKIEAEAKSAPAKLITEPQISSEELDELEAQLSPPPDEPEVLVPESAPDDVEVEMLPPLSEKDRFTAQFTVKVAGAELGPVSFNVLEDWARSGMIPPDALVAKTDEGRYFSAYSMPELRKLFDGETEEEPGKVIRELIAEESVGTKIAYGAAAGIIGGIIVGLLAAFVVLLGLWSPMWGFPPVMQALVVAGALAVVGIGIGAINAALGEYLIDYPWTAPVQAIIGLIFAVGMFISAIAMSSSLKSAAMGAGGVFILAFGAGFIACQFHHKLFEKVK